MTPVGRAERRVHALVLLAALAGLAAAVATVLLDRAPMASRPEVLVAFTASVALTWARPLFVLHADETEVLVLDEAFLVAMAFLLPPADVLLALAVGMGAGLAARRRPPIRVVFNVAATSVAATLGLGAMHLVASPRGPIGALTTVAVLVGAAVFFLTETTAVCLVIALSWDRPLRSVLTDGLGTRLLVLAGNCSIGLLGGLTGRDRPWSLLLALVPVGVLQLAYAGHLRSRYDRRRLDELLRTVVHAQDAIAQGRVEAAICERAMTLLDCETVRFDRRPPGPGELGALLPDPTGVPKAWLVAAGRRGFEPFDEADQRLLDATVALTSSALETAHLYRDTDEERRLLADVIASTSDGIFTVGGDRTITSWNPAMERIAGIGAAEAVGAKENLVFRARRPDGVELGVVDDSAAARLSGIPVPLEVTTAGGEPRWLSCAFAPLSREGYVVVARDVTAEHRVEVLQSAISLVSHELRSPITPIKGFAETLLLGDARLSSDERREFYTRLLRQSEQLERLVKDLWDATMEDRPAEYAIAPLDWPSVAAGVLDGFAFRAPDRVLRFDVEPDLPRVAADEQRAVQVLSNLLDNAAKYSFAGTPVHVTVGRVDDAVVTTVSDRGPGIPESERERVFERFARLDSSATSVPGIGLGLHLVRRLVEGMGGHVAVGASREGGAAFSFTLPVAAALRIPLPR